MTRGNRLVVTRGRGESLPPSLDHDLAAAIDRFDGVAYQVTNRTRQLRLRAAHGKRPGRVVDHHVDMAAPLVGEAQRTFRQAGFDHTIEIDILLCGPALTSKREEIFDGPGGSQGGGLDDLDVGAQVPDDVPVRFQIMQIIEDEIRQRHERAQSIVEIVRHPASENAQCLHPFRGGQALLHAALV